MTYIVEIIYLFGLITPMQVMQIAMPICMQKKPNDFNDEGHADNATPTERGRRMHASSLRSVRMAWERHAISSM